MSDFTPPSNSDPERGEDPNDWSGSHAGWEQSPPAGTPPEPSPWGQPPQPADWGGAGPQPNPGYGEYGQQPGAQYPYDPGASWQPPGQHGMKASQATTSLVLSIVGLLCCGPVSVIGAVMGRSELNSIGRGEIDPRHRGTAQAAFIIGLIGSILWLAFFALYIVAIAASAA